MRLESNSPYSYCTTISILFCFYFWRGLPAVGGVVFWNYTGLHCIRLGGGQQKSLTIVSTLVVTSACTVRRCSREISPSVQSGVVLARFSLLYSQALFSRDFPFCSQALFLRDFPFCTVRRCSCEIFPSVQSGVVLARFSLLYNRGLF